MGIFRIRVTNPKDSDEFLVAYTRTSTVIKQVMTQAKKAGYVVEESYTELADFDNVKEAMDTIRLHMPLT